MTAQERWMLAVVLVLADLVAVFVPLMAICSAYVVVARPAWFREWIARLYAD